MHDPERTVEFEFVRATENAALNAMRFIGKGDKNAADAAACDAIQGVFDLIDIRGEVVIGEGIKDNAPGIFLGDHLGKWGPNAPRFNIALDPVDGTTNLSKGSPNAISVMAAAEVPSDSKQSVMRNIPSYYSHKIAYGPSVAQALAKQDPSANFLDAPLEDTLQRIAKILHKRVGELVVLVLDRPRNQPFIESIRRAGASHHRCGGPVASRLRNRSLCWNRRIPRGCSHCDRSSLLGRRNSASYVVPQPRGKSSRSSWRTRKRDPNHFSLGRHRHREKCDLLCDRHHRKSSSSWSETHRP